MMLHLSSSSERFHDELFKLRIVSRSGFSSSIEKLDSGDQYLAYLTLPVSTNAFANSI